MSIAKDIYQQLLNSSASSVLDPASILIVNDAVPVRETLARKLTNLGYECMSCESGQEAFDLLASRSFDLVLADVLKPETGGAAFLKKALSISPDTAVILIASKINIEEAVGSLKDGAYDYITKPFSPEEVSISVARALDKRRLVIDTRNQQRILEEQVASRSRQLKEALGVLDHTYRSTFVALSRALESRNADPDGHSMRVTLYSKRLARKLELNELEMRDIEYGVLLRDIGKIGIPDDLLKKSGLLNEDEWLLMHRHPEIGYRILSNIKFLKGAAQLVLHHHEQYDGKGYPRNLNGDQISLGARIFAVANNLDDLTSTRPFRAAISFEDATEEIKKRSGNRLDPALVREFLEIPVSEWKNIRQETSAPAKCAHFLPFAADREVR
jgi:response regulator RpfG family c-di-GMP phosphodiesterase